jgi:hypothetical protein
MNKTALRKILASEGLLPQKKVALKALARMFTDFYKGVSRGWGPDPAARLDAQIRKAVHADLKKIMDSLRSAEATFGEAEADHTKDYAELVEIDFDYDSWIGLEEQIVLPTHYYVTGTISVRPLPFEYSYLADFLDDQYLLYDGSQHEREGKKKWDAFILKVMESKEFQQALLRHVSRWQQEAHEALYDEAQSIIEDIPYEQFTTDGSSMDDYPEMEASFWKVSADLVGVSRRGGSVEYTLKFTGVLDAEGVVEGMKFSWRKPMGRY